MGEPPKLIEAHGGGEAEPSTREACPKQVHRCICIEPPYSEGDLLYSHGFRESLTVFIADGGG